MADVLVIDDNAANRALVVTLLEHLGHRPLQATDGLEALQLARAERPQLAISDILMPKMDGFEFVRQLRSDTALASIQVIFYTAHYHEQEAKALASACGVSRVLIKPCEPEALLAAIQSALASPAQVVTSLSTQEFYREHLRLMTDKLSQKAQQLERHLSEAQKTNERIGEKLALENKLRRAQENGEFVLHYQPKVDVDTQRLAGVEALMRWQSPDLGMVLPNQFIPLLEETGMIVETGAWVLQQGSLARVRWLECNRQAPRISINVSTVQLQRQDFVRTTADILKTAGIEAGIDVEVTETPIMEDIDAHIAKLKALRELGVGIAIDDFGTGYSSLGHLAKLPADALKIDRTFIAAMVDDPDAMTLVSTMISLAHSLRLKVVAEGVESEEQAQILRLLRCDQMQGYLISKPLPFDEMTGWLAQWKN